MKRWVVRRGRTRAGHIVAVINMLEGILVVHIHVFAFSLQ